MKNQEVKDKSFGPLQGLIEDESVEDFYNFSIFIPSKITNN